MPPAIPITVRVPTQFVWKKKTADSKKVFVLTPTSPLFRSGQIIAYVNGGEWFAFGSLEISGSIGDGVATSITAAKKAAIECLRTHGMIVKS